LGVEDVLYLGAPVGRQQRSRDPIEVGRRPVHEPGQPGEAWLLDLHMVTDAQQQRAGRTFHAWDNTFAQLLFNVNFTHDVKNQYWAETLEMGPGVKVHLPWMAPNVYLSADFLRGVYTDNQYNPRRPNYNDIRVSLWYAITK